MLESMKQKLVVVIIDGLNDETAREELGFAEGLIEVKKGLKTTVQSILPSLSRPCYASIFTGAPSHVTGIVSNTQSSKLTIPSIFDLIEKEGGVSAISGYHWMSELYHEAPFDYVLDREQNHNETGFTFGRFYFDDIYPDSHVYVDAEAIRLRNNPNLLVIHPMGVDDTGHKFGSKSSEYKGKAAQNDALLAKFLPTWIKEGYQVIVTADHGMNHHGSHGGTTDAERVVPFYLFSEKIGTFGTLELRIPQTQLADMMCYLLDLQKTTTMQSLEQNTIDQLFNRKGVVLK